MPVARAQLKRAVEEEHWDLLDRLLELDHSSVNDNSLFTDTWGTWFGALYWCVGRNLRAGVQVLIKHGADPHLQCWGDCLPVSPLELAQEGGKASLLPLLTGAEPAVYQRQTDPEIPPETDADQAVNLQQEIANATGLTFQVETLPED
ncbi:hypothetical protein DYH09_08305 [bacterium CPR1]|nr:hypothetical protein [bacterium CPR1]